MPRSPFKPLRTARTRCVALLMAGTALAAFPGAVRSETTQSCVLQAGALPAECRNANADVTVGMPLGANAERPRAAPALDGTGFAISVNRPAAAGTQRDRAADIRLEDADVQVKYDGIFPKRRLNVVTGDLRSAFRAGEAVRFRTSMNYPGAVARAELRITPVTGGSGAPDVTTVGVQPNGTAAWPMPAGGPGEFQYVLRVYDADGRFDETAPLPLVRSAAPGLPELNGPVIAAGEAEDRTSLRTIPVRGGMVTVSGSGLPADATVTVMGQPVPVDADGGFVTERLLEYGAHGVPVAMRAPGMRGVTLEREVVIPRTDWFYVGIADLTFARRKSNGSTVSTSTEEGRLAFYAKGVIKGRTTVTASADTGGRDVGDLFRNFFDKSPRSLIDRLDPDNVYPTYGDDSRMVRDAPTSGRIYLKVERDQSHLMWGDFKGEINGTRFFDSSRNLYGAQGVYRSPAATAAGERRTELAFYAASPESLPQRDDLRGTGGSAYFLKHQDVVPRSETLRIETVDPNTGRVVQSRQLIAGRDYRIDYIQGTVILDAPLTSSASTGAVVSGGAGGTYDVNLVAQYEYEPTGSVLGGAASGGRLETWLPGDRLRVGVTGMSDTTGTADVKATGADARLTFGKASYVEAEAAQSKGTGFGKSVSTDGGLSFVDLPSLGSASRARAYRVDGVLDLTDLAPGMTGTVAFYAERKDGGFTTLTDNVLLDQRSYGLDADVALNARTGLRLRYKDFDETFGDRRLEATADLAYALTPDLKIEAGLRHQDSVNAADAADTGTRTDAGFRLTRTYDEDTSAYVFAQTTLGHRGGIARNDRAGLGGTVSLTGKLSAEGEVSGGSRGPGARALLSYRPSADARYYIGYTLDPDRRVAGRRLTGSDSGTLVAGADRRIGPATTIFGENSYDMFGQRRSLTSTYGVTYTPDAAWKYSGGIEAGRVRDAAGGDFDRTALSFGFDFNGGQGIRGKLRAEVRSENGTSAGAAGRDRRTYLLAGTYSRDVTAGLRVVGSLDALVSRSDQSAFLDGRYIEASVGLAYRPVGNDRLNALAKYTYLYDLPGADQVSADGSSSGSRQRSQIVSIDAIYELSETWELGGKLAYRRGASAPKGGGAFTGNDAALAALRASWHVVHDWDISGEVRALVYPSTHQRDVGLVASVYKHLNSTVKVGLGYNFGTFSDDLRDVSLDDRGVFVNVVAKF